MKTKTVEAWRIQPPHENVDPARVQALMQQMQARGWIGRPLLVEPRDDDGAEYQGWTGSHRLAAASQLGIEVPIQALNMDAWIEARDGRGRPVFRGKLERGQSLFAFLAANGVERGSAGDAERAEAAEMVGDRPAALLMKLEARANSLGMLAEPPSDEAAEDEEAA